MEKQSPCHAEVWENYSKQSIETQWMNKFYKKHNKFFFHQEKRFREFVSKQAPGTPNLTQKNNKAANPLPHALSPSYRLMNTQRMAWNQLMYSEENRFQKHAAEKFSIIEVVSQNISRNKDPINQFKKISWNSWW